MDVLHKTPVDGNAARVAFWRADHFKQTFKTACLDTEYPPAVATRDRFGKRFGRLVVLGDSAEFKNRLACRCDCGLYCIRTVKALYSGGGIACDHCYEAARTRKREASRRGVFKNIEDFLK